LGQERRLVRWFLPQRRNADHHLLFGALDEAFGCDLATQMRSREIGSHGRDAGIEVQSPQPFASGTIESFASAPGM